MGRAEVFNLALVKQRCQGKSGTSALAEDLVGERVLVFREFLLRQRELKSERERCGISSEEMEA